MYILSLVKGDGNSLVDSQMLNVRLVNKEAAAMRSHLVEVMDPSVPSRMDRIANLVCASVTGCGNVDVQRVALMYTTVFYWVSRPMAHNQRACMEIAFPALVSTVRAGVSRNRRRRAMGLLSHAFKSLNRGASNGSRSFSVDRLTRQHVVRIPTHAGADALASSGGEHPSSA